MLIAMPQAPPPERPQQDARMDAIAASDRNKICAGLLDFKTGFVSLLKGQRRLTINMLPTYLGCSHPGTGPLAEALGYRMLTY